MFQTAANPQDSLVVDERMQLDQVASPRHRARPLYSGELGGVMDLLDDSEPSKEGSVELVR